MNQLLDLDYPVKQSKNLEHFINDLNCVTLSYYKFLSKPLPFKASFIPSGDQVFTVSPKFGELLPESEDGTLIKVGFTPATYGKVYQSQLIISVKYLLFIKQFYFQINNFFLL